MRVGAIESVCEDRGESVCESRVEGVQRLEGRVRKSPEGGTSMRGRDSQRQAIVQI